VVAPERVEVDVPPTLGREQEPEIEQRIEELETRHASLAVAGVDSFLLDPLPPHFDVERVVVFTTIAPFPMKMHESFVSAKRAELEHEVRVQFREKLAWCFGRHAEDVPDDKKFDKPGT
jgi:hypothetical protein